MRQEQQSVKREVMGKERPKPRLREWIEAKQIVRRVDHAGRPTYSAMLLSLMAMSKAIAPAARRAPCMRNSSAGMSASILFHA